MLQAHVDDSKSDGKLFVLAGYIAPTETWAVFADEWKAELCRDPVLVEFKMTEMNRAASWNPGIWDRCSRFYSIIERHVTAAISVTIPLDDFANAVRGTEWPPGIVNPEVIHSHYWWAFQCIVSSLAQHQRKIGIVEPIDLVFDEQSERAQFRGTWADYKARARAEERELMGDEPIFRKSHDVLPLQAADLWAWWIRRWLVDGVDDGLGRLAFKWPVTRSIPRFNVHFNEADLRRQFLQLNQNVWNIFAARHLYINPWCRSWPPFERQRS